MKKADRRGRDYDGRKNGREEGSSVGGGDGHRAGQKQPKESGYSRTESKRPSDHVEGQIELAEVPDKDAEQVVAGADQQLLAKHSMQEALFKTKSMFRE